MHAIADPSHTRTVPAPHVLDFGAGPGVVCLHANASASGQWRHLGERLGARFRVLAPDLYGSGRSPSWPWARPPVLADEADFVEPVLARAGAPFVLVGHSYGAAVALVAALRQPERVAALVLYEPTLFAWIDADTARPNDADGIRDAVADAQRALHHGDAEGAAERFVDYWAEPGTFRAMPPARRAAVAAAIPNIGRWKRALFGEPTPLAACHALDMPVLLMQGERTTASARAVTSRLRRVLPHAEFQAFEGLGHMGPVADAARVDAAIERFIERALAPSRGDVHAARPPVPASHPYQARMS